MTAEITNIDDLRKRRIAGEEIHPDVEDALGKPVTTEELLAVSRTTVFNLEKEIEEKDREIKRLKTNLSAAETYAKYAGEENIRVDLKLRDQQALVDCQGQIIREQDALIQQLRGHLARFGEALEQNHQVIDRLLVERGDPWLADSGVEFVAFFSNLALACGRAWHRLRKFLGIYRREINFVRFNQEA
jgi:hypothetical protein